jgi:hypothetical protein
MSRRRGRTKSITALVVANLFSPLAATSLHAQAAIPVRALPAPTTVSTDSIGYFAAVRPLSDGRVLVNDVRHFRVLLYDKTLTSHTTVIDADGSIGASTFIVATAHLIPAAGDSTFYVDFGSRSVLLIDPDGKVVRPVALPRPRDVGALAYGANYGTPVLDPKGRLVYRADRAGTYRPLTAAEMLDTLLRRATVDEAGLPDSGAIVRADFDARTVDTIATVKLARRTARVRYTRVADGNVTKRTTVNPFDAGDEWALLPDGTIAIVRAHDYHIDWIDPDGTRRSSPRMAFDWKRLTDEDKGRKVAEWKPWADQLTASQRPEPLRTAYGPRRMANIVEIVSPSELPDYEQPIAPGSVKVDLDGNLWIVPRTAITDGTVGLRYDVVERSGRVIERVTVPKGRAIAAFEKGGTVILTNFHGGVTTLERAPLR